jgi:hypothetical protein
MAGSDGFGNQDTAALEKACHDAWSVRGYGEGVQPGLMVVFVRHILNTGQHGFSSPQTVYNSQGKNCLKPYSFTAADVAGRWSFIEIVDDNKARSMALIGNTVAHELGHQLLVRHGHRRRRQPRSEPRTEFGLLLPGILTLHLTSQRHTMKRSAPHSHSMVAGGLPEMS